MKKIVIYQENLEPIILYDKDYTDISLYISELSKILKSKEIISLEATSGNVIIKPSKISSIYVSSVDEKEKDIEIIKKNKDEESNVDIITDGDE